MIQAKFISDTINILDYSLQDDIQLDDEDYQNISLLILKCESYTQTDEQIKYLKDRDIDLVWFSALTDLFYAKMRSDIESEDEE